MPRPFAWRASKSDGSPTPWSATVKTRCPSSRLAEIHEDLPLALARVGVLDGIGDQLGRKQDQGDGPIRRETNTFSRRDLHRAAEARQVEIATHVAQIGPEVQRGDIVVLVKALMGPRDRQHPACGIAELPFEFGIGAIAGLEVQHAGNQLQAVLDAMINLLQQHLLPFQSGRQAPLATLALDGHAQQVRRTLEKGDVGLGEVAFGSGIDLEHLERSAVTLQDDVHGTADTVPDEQLRRLEALLVLQVIGDHGLSRAQSKAGRRGEVGVDLRVADYAFAPSHPGAYHKAVLARQELHDLAELGLQPLGREARRPVEKIIQRRTLQREDAELGKDFPADECAALGRGPRALRS